MQMTMDEIIEFCDRWLKSWTGNQPDELIRFYSEEIFYRDPAYPNGITNRQKLLEYFTKLLAKNPAWVWKREETIKTEKGFVLKWRAEIPKGTEIVTEFGLDIVELSNNLIVRNEVYFDPSRLGKK